MATRHTEIGKAEEFSALLARARRGDEGAIAALYERHVRRVASIVRRRLPRSLRAKYDTMDFAQSVFAEVIRDLPRLEDRGERAFEALLAIKAQNKLRTRLRRHLGKDARRVEARLLSGDDRFGAGTDVATELGARDDDARLRRVLVALDETTRAILHRHSEGETFGDIAAGLGLQSADAARKRHARALADVRRRWSAAAR